MLPVLWLGLLVAATAVGGCESAKRSPVPSPTSGAVAPSRSPRLPTPVPTPVLPSPGPTAAASQAATTGTLLLRLTNCSDTCGPDAGTTLLDDGRLIWASPEGTVLQGQLTDAAMVTVREAIEATPELAGPGEYQAIPRQGAEPTPRGRTLYRFEVHLATGDVVVTSGNPSDFDDEQEKWIIPPEMRALGELARRFGDPVKWLGPAAFADGPEPYAAARYLVLIELYEDLGDSGSFPVDVDDVEWPFGGPIEAAGSPVGPAEDGLAPRCLIVDAETAEAMRKAEAAAGAPRNLRTWFTTVPYAWKRADGFVHVSTTQLLPHEDGPCATLVLSEP